jgi:DHA3 family macrolide efflux protein-like MFS transporter
MFLRSLGGTFHWSAMQSSTSLMVPEKHLSRVAGITHALHGTLNIAAPPLGALLMSLLEFYQVIAVDVVTALLAILPLLFLRIPQPIRSDEEKAVTPRLIWQDVVAGFRYLKNWKGLFLLTLMAALFYFFLIPAFTLIPLMVTEHFKAGVWELSIIESAFGIGLVVGGLLLGVWGGFKNKAITIAVGAIGSGVGTLLFGLASPQGFWFGAAMILLLGIMESISGGPFIAVIQSRVSPEMQGRVIGSTNSLLTAMMPLSMLVMTPVAELLGLRIWYWVGGSLTILIGVSAFFIPAIMSMDSALVKKA